MNYTALAPFYDLLMDHVKYIEWITLIDSITKRYSKAQSTTIFEIGGGTGKLGMELIKKGYSYTGSDISYSMSKQAKIKKLPFFCADACLLPVKKKFDLVIFLYDGINYLLDLNRYKNIFIAVSSCLNTYGLFLFDITTVENSYRYFFDIYDFHEYKRSSIIRHSHFNPKQSLQINDFTIFSPIHSSNTLYVKQTEHHFQKVYNPEQIKSSIPNTLFKCLGIWDGFSMQSYQKDSERIHFLLQKIE